MIWWILFFSNSSLIKHTSDLSVLVPLYYDFLKVVSKKHSLVQPSLGQMWVNWEFR